MGLDMYAFALSKQQVEEAENIHRAVWEGEEIWYWRKHHDLHGWFKEQWEKLGRPSWEEENYTRGTEFNGDAIEITEDMLTELSVCIQKRMLPHTTGFFFGDFPPDDESDAEDLEFIQKALKEIRSGNRVFYTSSW